jgi:hypothetical protein
MLPPTALPSDRRRQLTTEIAQAAARLTFAGGIQDLLAKVGRNHFCISVRDTEHQPTAVVRGTIERMQLAHLADHLTNAAEHDLREATKQLTKLLDEAGPQPPPPPPPPP